MPKIYILDTTNRDGVQTVRIHLSKLQKTLINLYLNNLGITMSEFGFPCTEHEWFYLPANLELAEMGLLKPIKLVGWIPTGTSYVKLALKMVPKLEHLTISISTSEKMRIGKWGGKKSWQDILNEITESIKFAKEKGIKMIGVTAEDASRTELDRLIEFGIKIKEAGANRLRYADTLGCENPTRIRERMKKLAEEVKIPLEAHCHNDLNMAEANAIAGAIGALEGGVDCYINTTVNSLGERAGNADLISVLLGLTYAKGISEKEYLDERIRFKGESVFPATNSKPVTLWKLATYVSNATGIPIPINQPGAGRNIFSTSSGIHAAALLKDTSTYELFDPQGIGRGEEPEVMAVTREIIAGGFSGKAAIMEAAGKLGIEFKTDEEAERFIKLTREIDQHNRKEPTGDELRFIAQYPDIASKIMTAIPDARIAKELLDGLS